MVYYPTFGCPSAPGAGEFTCWMESGWGPMIIVCMSIVLLFYAIVYMLSFFLQSEEMKKSAKSHLLDAVFSALLAGMIVVLLGNFFTYLQTNVFAGASVNCDMFGTISLGAGGDPFAVIKCRLMEKASFVTTIYEQVIYSARGPFEKLTLAWGLFGLPIYMQGAYAWQTSVSDVYTEVEGYRLLAHTCVALLIGINGYIAAVDYIQMNMLRMFLPIGIVLRSIPFTRNIGAFFIGLAIGFYIIFPFFFAVTDPGYVKVPVTYVDITDTSNILLPYPSFKGVVSMMTLPPQTQTGSFVFGSINVRQAAAELARFYYSILIQPVVVLSITLVFVRYITLFFGGEAQELYRLATKVI